MHGSDDLSVALARLLASGQSPDVNIRPVLLRAVVDLFVNKAHHAPADLRQFEAIASALLDQAEPETRRAVAQKLASHPLVPRALVERFLGDAEPIAVQAYAAAPLDPATLVAAATWGSAAVAEAVARRRDLSAEVAGILAARPEDEVLLSLAANRAAPLDRGAFQQLVRRARENEPLAEVLVARPADPIDLAPLFALAGPELRMAIIDAARRLELGKRQWGRLDTATAATLARLDNMVMAGEREMFEIALAQALWVEPSSMVALLQDEGGEILALSLAAVGASEEQAARAFILGDPRISHSADRVFALTNIVSTVSAHAARRLIGAMTAMPVTTRHRALPPKQVAPRRAEQQSEPAPALRTPSAQPTRRRG